MHKQLFIFYYHTLFSVVPLKKVKNQSLSPGLQGNRISQRKLKPIIHQKYLNMTFRIRLRNKKKL
jgi:hypothetical protein